MAPDARRRDLLYVSDFGAGSVFVYAYASGKPLGKLAGLVSPAGECVDRTGNVFVTQARDGSIREYAHGGLHPVATLQDASGYPVSCAVDPTTGDLAVANQVSPNGRAGVSIYTAAHGAPTTYAIKTLYQEYSVGYDDRGNLFVDGVDVHNRFRLAERDKGAKTFTRVKVDQPIEVPGNVQWDGAYVAIGDQAAGKIYRFAIGGHNAAEVGSTTLGGARDACQFWIRNGTVVGPNFSGASVMFWNYPAGGAPRRTIGGLNKPFGVTISPAHG